MSQNQAILIVTKSIIMYKGKSLIIQRTKEDEIGGGSWECAGGGLEFGESLEASLLREIKEEVGLSVEIERLLYAATFKTSADRQVVVLMYLSHSSSDQVILSKEHSDYKWATLSEMKEKLAPEILKDFERNNIFSLPIFLN